MSKRTAARAQLDQDTVRASTRPRREGATFSRDMAATAHEKRTLAAESATRALEDQLRQRDAKIVELENDRRWLADREKDATETKERDAAQWRDDKARLEEQLRRYRTTADSTTEELEELIEKHAELNSKYNAVTLKFESRNSTASREIEMLRQQLATATQTADARIAEVNALQTKLDHSLADRAESTHRGQDEQSWNVIRDELHRQATSFKKLEVENARLTADLRVFKSRAQSADVLREEKLSLEKRLERAEGFRQQAAKLEAEVDAARKERAQWTKQRRTASTAVTDLSKLRVDYATLLEAQGALKVDLREKEAAATAAETSTQEAQQLVATLRDRVNELEEAAVQRERRVILADQEVAFLNALVATYDAENKADGQQTQVATEDSVAQRIEHLTKSVESYKAECRELEQQIRVVRQSVKAQTSTSMSSLKVEDDSDESRQALSEAQEVIANQETKIDKLQQELFELRGDIAQGNHVPPKTRVLEFSQNPLQIWVETQQSNLDRLKNENMALLARLAELDDAAPGQPKQQLVPRESIERLQGENAQLLQTVAQKQKRFDRLVEVYTAKSNEFKNAVSMLLGFKLTFEQNGRVKVRSIYDVSAWFTFAPDEEDSKRLVIQDIGSIPGINMESVINNYLHGRGSVPCFMAAITLECQDQYRVRA
ncbi:spindle assembly checkpoint component Mad1 [Auriculariales sp. MPI-PUGE-AT-0066]|nr:spindle assembly checkpoint component Mad1 [Auriculariales sp. MPI-PUGE-AT-0066]